ncbi:unnamed protein product [Haemonchus placei]|uniref:Uncharacterized protein n=1 Tax=Haemonchus placei TaxID=6290 RepID=A0A3P7ZBB2_HAEPC|nr:unnamed protein product [Haemonchus placei]
MNVPLGSENESSLFTICFSSSVFGIPINSRPALAIAIVANISALSIRDDGSLEQRRAAS